MKDRKQYKNELEKERKNTGTTTAHVFWKFFRPILIVLISLAIVAAGIFYGINFVMDKFVMPVAPGDDDVIMVEIKSGWGSSSIAEKLYSDSEKTRLIRNKMMFKVYVDFIGKASKLRAGTYAFSKSMGVEEIVNMLVAGSNIGEATIKFRITEGMTVKNIADELVKQGVLKDSKKFLEICRTGDDVNFTVSSNVAGEKLYTLEGYLFPDTYEVYKGSSEKTIISRMLTRFNDIMTADYVDLMAEKDMTVDQVVTLASMIEKEAKTDDFRKVSAVFYNRLKKGMLLESDVTIKYYLSLNEIVIDSTALKTDTRYNTHKYTGLPIGPICNPGQKAIEAALNPDQDYIDGNYQYFCLMEPESGKLAFSKTLSEHNKAVAKYKPLWDEYDRRRAEIDALPSPSLTPSPSPTLAVNQ